MFKTAASKIAHNSTLPSLGGNQDLRPLQDLIAAEKAVLISLQKLSVDYSKASEALRTWGLNEGDDLGDILSASTSILNHFSSALSQYAAHGHSMREQLKAIRTKEESLDELKRRRRTVGRKAEDAEKKLSKMSQEHKNLAMQTETLHRLQDEIRTMDSDIMTEEAALGDFKRAATRTWVGLKFAGLLECCEKGTIAGEYGKLTIAEISEETTQPGLPRSLYYGHSKVEGLVAEAHRCVNEVTISTVQSAGRDRGQYEQKPFDPPPPAFNSPQIGHGEPPKPLTSQSDILQPPIRPFVGSGSFLENHDSSLSLVTSLGHAPPYQAQPSQRTVSSSTLPSQQLGVNEGTIDDFGVNARSPGAGGRFATFPVKTRPPGSSGGYSLQDRPALGGRQTAGDSSFSASIAEALHEKEEKAGTLSPWGNQFTASSESSTRATAGSYSQSTSSTGGRSDSDLPPFEGLPSMSVTAPSSQIPVDNNKQPSGQFSSLPPPPPGAAAPEVANLWAPIHSRLPSHLSENDDALLAYTQDSPPIAAASLATPPTTATTTTTLSDSTMSEEDQSLIRHVRFGAVEDVDEKIEKRVSQEKEQAVSTRSVGTTLSLLSEAQNSTTSLDKGPRDTLGNSQTNGAENNSHAQQGKPARRRVPPPTIEEDEKALNAAAAREISLELEALKNNNQHQLPPLPSHVDQRSDQTTDVDSGRPMATSTSRFNDYPGPGARDASPITAPSGGRNQPPHPYAELNQPGTYSPYATSQPYLQQPYQSPPVSPAQAYAQSYQQQQQQQPPSSSPYAPYTQPQAPDIRSALPPRFQALNNNMDSQVPPRFQSSSTPIVNSLPPRFQTNYTPPVSAPGGVNISDQQQRDDPLAYPRPLAPFTKSNTGVSLQARGPTPPLNVNTGARTINAAAFKRPIQRNPGSVDAETAIGKKALPNSPYPMRDAAVTASSGVHGNEMSDGGQQQHRKQHSELEDEFDYISAYVNNSPSSPQRTDSGPGAGTR